MAGRPPEDYASRPEVVGGVCLHTDRFYLLAPARGANEKVKIKIADLKKDPKDGVLAEDAFIKY
jgi:hypothetical protein